MRPMDLFVERGAGDRSCDFQSSRALSREIDGMTVREWMERSKSLSTNDKMSIASASIMLGSPFFLLSLGATFAIVDECDNNRIENELNRRYRWSLPGSRAVEPLSSSGTLESKLLSNWMAPGAAFALDYQSSGTANKKRKSEAGLPSDQAVFSAQYSRNCQNSEVVEEKSWLKASKVLKQKFFLEDELERVNGQADFSLVAAIVSQIEKLDKELARLGC